MAPNRTFKAWDEIVEISCNGWRYKPIKVFHPLLTNNTGFIEINRGDDEKFTAKVDEDGHYFNDFARWLYSDLSFKELLRPSLPFIHADLGYVAHLSDVGRTMGCYDFMDFVLDGFVSILSEHCKICPDYVIRIFAAVFPPKSGGWNLAIDFLLNSCEPKRDEETDEYEDEDEDQNDDEDEDHSQPFIMELALRIKAKEGFDMARTAIENPRFCKMLVHGFFETVKADGRAFEEDSSWEDPTCKYHIHRELAFPCYKSPTVQKPVLPPGSLGGAKRQRTEVEDEEADGEGRRKVRSRYNSPDSTYGACKLNA